jgi:hypothetical protein
MAKDIPIDSGSDFTADVVKAVEAIAQNIKNSSTAFTGNFDKIAKSVKTMQTAVVNSIKQIKLVAPVNKKDVKKEEAKDLTSGFSRIVDAIQNIKLVFPVEKQSKKETEKKTTKSKQDATKEKASKKEKAKEPKEVKQPKQKDYSKDISSGFKSVTTSVKDMTKQIVASVGKIKLNVGKPEKSKAEKKKETEGKANFAQDISSGFASIVNAVYEASILITNAIFEVGTSIVNELTKTKEEPKKESKEEPKKETKEKSEPDFYTNGSGKTFGEKPEEPKKNEIVPEQKASTITIAKAMIQIQQAIIMVKDGKQGDKKKEGEKKKQEEKKSPVSSIVADLKKAFNSLINKIPGASQLTKGSLFSGEGNSLAKKVGGAVGGSAGAASTGAAAAGLGMALNSVTGAVGIATGAIGMFGSYVEKSNPALMEQFGIILNDLGGVIGRSLAPVIQSLLPLFRQFADYIDYAMKLIQPSINVVINAFKALAGPLMEAGATILKVFAPVLVFAAKILEGLVIVVTPLIDAFAEFIEIIGEMFSAFFDGIGITQIMMNGFKLMADAIKILVGAITWAAGAFYQVIGAAIKGIGALIDWIPGTGELGQTLMKMGEDADKAGKKLRESGAGMISSGLTGKAQDKKESKIKQGASVGAAVREAQDVSISGIGDDIRKSAMMAGMGQKSQEESLNDISKNLEKNNLAAAVAQGMIDAQAKIGGKPQGFKNDTTSTGSGGYFDAPS